MTILIKCLRVVGLGVIVGGFVSGCGVNSGPSGGDGWVRLFDGETFEGWEGDRDYFRIEGGAIVGGSLENKIPRNEFLTTKKVYRDFELRLKVRLQGDPARANAGIQIRSHRIPDHHEMIGHQADMGQHYWACLYDESRRRKILLSSQKLGLR